MKTGRLRKSFIAGLQGKPKPEQKEAIISLLNGKEVFAVQPTPVAAVFQGEFVSICLTKNVKGRVGLGKKQRF